MHQPWLRTVSQQWGGTARVDCVALVRRAQRAVRPGKQRRPRQAGRWKTHNCGPGCSASRSAAAPATKPPVEPRALLRVPIRTARGSTPGCSQAPRPVSPLRPWRACSTSSRCRMAIRQVGQPGSGAKSPSMLNSPSVTIKRRGRKPRGLLQDLTQVHRIAVAIDLNPRTGTGGSRRSGWRDSWHRCRIRSPGPARAGERARVGREAGRGNSNAAGVPSNSARAQFQFRLQFAGGREPAGWRRCPSRRWPARN